MEALVKKYGRPVPLVFVQDDNKDDDEEKKKKKKGKEA